jgi:alpha-D-xyloside xylohydrolase
MFPLTSSTDADRPAASRPRRYRDFTFDPVNYPLPKVRAFVAALAAAGRRWVPILDPGIKIDPGYAAYDAGVAEDVFVKGVDGAPYVGQVWAGPALFPDFLAPRARRFFAAQIQAFYELAPFSGLWLDMNEPSNFCTGDVCAPRAGGERSPRTSERNSTSTASDEPLWACRLECAAPAALNATQRGLAAPPYAVASAGGRAPLGARTISSLATHLDGSIYHYDAHNLYGHAEALAAHDAARAALADKRPFILTRSSFAGTGAFAAHWTGDSASTWDSMRQSIPGVAATGLAGLPLAGADVCGYSGDASEELCRRWVALGALYPLARSHSDAGAAPQEPYRWPAVAAAARASLARRYALLPYLYSALREARDAGAPVLRPLWVNFPWDDNALRADGQFMLGGALLATPVLAAGAAAVEGYFPAGQVWYDLFGGAGAAPRVDARAAGLDAALAAPPHFAPLHVAGGAAVPTQPPARTTAAVAAGPLTLLFALPHPLDDAANVPGEQLAAGWMYHDDGEAADAGPGAAPPCAFLAFNATVTRGGASSEGGGGAPPRAEVLVLFGRRGEAAGTCAGDAGCAPWSPLAALEVLGWAGGAGPVRVEVVRRRGAGGALEALRAGPPARAAAAGDRLRVALGAGGAPLRCPEGLRVSWAGEAAGPAAAA